MMICMVYLRFLMVHQVLPLSGTMGVGIIMWRKCVDISVFVNKLHLIGFGVKKKQQ